MVKLRDLLITTVVTITVASCGGGGGGGAPPSTNTYKVGGTVTGLRGTGLTLQNNGGDSLQIAADGRFTFATSVASGSPYSISVQSQPTPAPGAMAQHCVVSSGAGTVGGADVTSVVVTCMNRPARFVYVANSGSNNVSGFSINVDTGALTALSGSPFPAGSAPRVLTVHPDGHHAYLTNVGDNSISVYTIDASSGVLGSVSGSPFLVTPVASSAQPGLTPVAIDPSGQLAIVGNASAPFVGNMQPNNLTIYRINAATGALTPVGGSPFSTNADFPVNLTFDPTGHFLYVGTEFDVLGGARSTIASYAIDAGAGTLTAVPGSPYTVARSPDRIVNGLRIDPSGRFAVVHGLASHDSSNLYALSIDPVTGALTPVPGSPFAVGVDPEGIAFVN